MSKIRSHTKIGSNTTNAQMGKQRWYSKMSINATTLLSSLCNNEIIGEFQFNSFSNKRILPVERLISSTRKRIQLFCERE